MFEQKNHLKIC